MRQLRNKNRQMGPKISKSLQLRQSIGSTRPSSILQNLSSASLAINLFFSRSPNAFPFTASGGVTSQK
jgi:hypothetical protein